MNTLENKITEEQMEDIINTMNEEMEKHNEIDDITEEQMKTVPTEIVSEDDQTVVFGAKAGEVPNIYHLKTSDKDILDVLDNNIKDNPQVSAEKIVESVKDEYSISESEVKSFTEALIAYSNNENINYYNLMPASIKFTIDSLAAANGIPKKYYNDMTKKILDEFIDDSELDNIFVDFDKSIKKAIQIPSTADMYLENTKETIINKLQELSDTVREENPEKADTLLKIKDSYIQSINFERLIDSYNNNGKVRKAVRRDFDKVKRYCDEYNFRNEKSIFKMNDCNIVLSSLKKVLIDDGKLLIFVNSEEEENIEQDLELTDITEVDIAKFVVLFCKSSENLNPHNVVDASYMYYGMKNIIMLMYTDKTKTEFAAELINNIVNIIKFIRIKEEEFNVSDLSKQRKSKNKSRK